MTESLRHPLRVDGPLLRAFRALHGWFDQLLLNPRVEGSCLKHPCKARKQRGGDPTETGRCPADRGAA